MLRLELRLPVDAGRGPLAAPKEARRSDEVDGTEVEAGGAAETDGKAIVVDSGDTVCRTSSPNS